MSEKEKGTEEICSNFAENWSLVGYRYIYFDRGLRRILWLKLLLASTVFAAFLFCGAIEDYIKRETYNVESAKYDTTSLDFPTVTLCNINALNIKKARSAGFVDSVEQFQEEYHSLLEGTEIGSPEISEEWFKANGITTAREAYNVFQSNYDDMTDNEVIRKIRPTGACWFNSKPCSRNDIKSTLSWEEATLCHQFNSFTPNKHASKSLSTSSTDAGLKMLFNIESEYLMIAEHEFIGLELLIHPYGTPHFILEYTNKIYLQAGTMNIITVEPRKIYSLPEPFATKCVESAPYDVIKGLPYSKAMCEVDCITKKIVEQCGCVGFELEDFVVNTSICTIKQMKCYLTHKDKYKADRPNTCKKTCNLGCVETQYHIRSEQVTIGNNDIYQRIANIKGWENRTKAESAFFIQENIVGVIVGFNAIIERTSTVTQSVTWGNLLGQIGGNFGLCMGFNILSLFELMFFIYDLIWSLYRKRKDVEEETESLLS